MRLDPDTAADGLDEAPDHAVVALARPPLRAEHRNDVRIRLVTDAAVRDRLLHDLEVGVGDGLVDHLRALLVERDPPALEVEMPSTEPRHRAAP